MFQNDPYSSLFNIRIDIIEGILEFHMAYEPVSKFDTFRCFLELNEREFELFRKSYEIQKDFFVGHKKDLGFRDLKNLEREKRLPRVFDPALKKRAKARLKGVQPSKTKIEDTGMHMMFELHLY